MKYNYLDKIVVKNDKDRYDYGLVLASDDMMTIGFVTYAHWEQTSNYCGFKVCKARPTKVRLYRQSNDELEWLAYFSAIERLIEKETWVAI